MSEKNVKVVRAIFEALARRDREALDALARDHMASLRQPMNDRMILRLGVMVATFLLIGWLATTNSPDTVGPWVVGGVVTVGLIWLVLIVRRTR